MPPLNRGNAMRTGAAIAELFDALSGHREKFVATVTAHPARAHYNAKGLADYRKHRQARCRYLREWRARRASSAAK